LIVTEKLDVTTLAQDTCNLEPKKQRSKLFSSLSGVIDVSETKFKMDKASNSDRQKWAKVIVSAIQVYGKILNDSEIEEVKTRLEVLELTVNKK
jgi:Mor family transcriptional regulator